MTHSLSSRFLDWWTCEGCRNHSSSIPVSPRHRKHECVWAHGRGVTTCFPSTIGSNLTLSVIIIAAKLTQMDVAQTSSLLVIPQTPKSWQSGVYTRLLSRRRNISRRPTGNVSTPGSRSVSRPFLTMLASILGRQITFESDDTEAHYHIPLLISPYSFTTYRGS